jgi:hypothetical protein
MGRSFFGGTDAGLYAGSNHFSAKINATPAAYGLTEALAAEYAVLNEAYAAAYLAATTPGTRSRGTVAAKNQTKVPLKRMASDLAQIVAGSGVSDEQRVALGLAVRGTGSPVGPPGTPTGFGVRLPGDGSVEVSWTCRNPPGARGTVYEVWRRVGGDSEFAYLGGTGAKRFLDATLPAGAAAGGVTYQVRAARSTKVGDWGQFNVNFGVVGVAAGGQIAAAAAAAKLAA